MTVPVATPFPVEDVPGVETDTVSLPSGRFLVRRAGAGPSVVVLHRDVGGFGWTPLNRALAEHFTVHALAMPGFDGSDRPDWLRSVPLLAVLVGNVLDDLGLASVGVVGLGFGGWVAAELMVLHAARVRGAVMQAPMGIKPVEGEILDQFLYAAPDYVRTGFADELSYEKLFGPDLDERQLFTWELNRETLTRIGWKPYMHNPALPHLLRYVDAPVMLVRGSRDRIVPASCLDAYASVLPNAARRTLNGGGHFLEIEMAADVAAITFEFFSTI